MEKKLVLFDVDHTLMDIGASHRNAFDAGFKQILGLNLDIHKIWKFHGYTDLQIIHEIMDRYKIKKDPTIISQIMQVMIDSFKKENLSHAFLLDGVPAILDHIKKNKNIIVGLVTGNLEEIAYIKLKHFNISEYFVVGGFGDLSIIRSDLVNYAINKAEKDYGKIKLENVYVIGDTIWDVSAAKGANVKSIAVATGSYTFEQLKESKPDYIFENLKDADKITDVILNG